jgi:hypothetical protein
MAINILRGGSFVLIPESWAKNAKKGILIPALRNPPVEAIRSVSKIPDIWLFAMEDTTIDSHTKPLKRGNADNDAAPTIQKIHVKGMVLYKPPKSVAFTFPVRYMTAPIVIKRSDL